MKKTPPCFWKINLSAEHKTDQKRNHALRNLFRPWGQTLYNNWNGKRRIHLKDFKRRNYLWYYLLIKEKIKNTAHEGKIKIRKHSPKITSSVLTHWERVRNYTFYFLYHIPTYPTLNTLFQSLPTYYIS